MIASPTIVSRFPADGPARQALVAAGRARFSHAVQTLSPLVRAEIAAFFLVAAVLLAIHAKETFYVPGPGDVGATAITFGSRLVFASLLLATLILTQFAPRVLQHANDGLFLRGFPLSAGVRMAWRSDVFTLAATPLAVLGIGLYLPPLEFGEWIPALLLLATWFVWLWCATQVVSLVVTWAPEGRLGPGGIGGRAGRVLHFVSVPIVGFLYFAAREASIALTQNTAEISLLLTIAMGLGVGYLIRRSHAGIATSSDPVHQQLAEHRALSEWKRKRPSAARPKLSLVPFLRTRTPVLVWMAKDSRVALRTPSLFFHWTTVVVLKVLVVVLAVAAGPDVPWPFAGLILVGADVIAAIAILLQWQSEQPGWIWSSPVSRIHLWLAHLIPALALSLVASAFLAVWAAVHVGGGIARPLALWTIVSGVSLVVAAANLGIASPPRSALGQNLFSLGLLSVLLVSAVYPVVGWAALAVFALYTTRSLTRDPRP